MVAEKHNKKPDMDIHQFNILRIPNIGHSGLDYD